jgi:hypothetical protein
MQADLVSDEAMIETYKQMHATAKELGYTSILEALEATPTAKAVGPMTRCPQCRCRFQVVHDVDAHLATLKGEQL